MSTCIVSGNIVDITGAAVASVDVIFKIVSPVTVGTSTVTPGQSFVSTNASGDFSISVQQSVSVLVEVQYPILGSEPLRSMHFVANIPALATANFTDIITSE